MMLMKETEEKPTYVAIIISSPLTWFSRTPYPQPNRHASGMAIPMAPANPATPTSPNSMLRVAPSSPAIIPSGRPKLSPQPACTMGIMASTITPFIPKRTIVSISDASIRTPTEGATTNSESSTSPMMIRGQPARSMNCRSLSMTHHLIICVLEFADHEHAKFFCCGGRGQNACHVTFVNNSDPIADGTQLLKLRRYHDNGRPIFAVVPPQRFQDQRFCADVDTTCRF